MKKLLFSTTLIAVMGIFNSQAQITIDQTDVASIGDTILFARDTTPTGIAVGGTGMQTWNFSSIGNDFMEQLIFVNPSVTPSSSSFPNSNLATDNNGSSYNYFGLGSNELLFLGFYGNPFGFGDVTIVFDQPDKMLEFPATNNTSFTSKMRLDYKFAITPPQFGVDSARIIRNSYATRTIDAYGMMTNPDSTYDCLRQFSQDTIVDSLFMRSSGSWTPVPPLFLGMLQQYGFNYDTNPDTSLTYTYRWIAKNEGMPVVEVTTDAPGGTALRASYKTFKTGLSVYDEPEMNSNLHIYPNPNDGKFQLQVTGNQLSAATVQIYNVLGEKVYSSTLNLTAPSVTTNLLHGIYFCKVSDGDRSIIKKMVVTK